MHSRMLYSGRRAGLYCLPCLLVAALALVACGSLEVGVEPTPTPLPTSTVTPVPTPGSFTYTNQDYGFTFHYPSSWTLTESPNAVELYQGTVVLRIGYKWGVEAVDIWNRTGLPAGDLLYQAKVTFLGQIVPRRVLAYERKYKAAFYGETQLVQAGDLFFSIVLEDLESDYELLDIPEEVMAQADQIVASFTAIPAQSRPAVLTPTPTGSAPAPVEWMTYAQPEYGFAFRYPSAWALEEVPGTDLGVGGKLADAVLLFQDPLVVRIQYKHFSQGDVALTGSGPASAMVPQGTVSLAGSQVARRVLLVQDQVKVVEYNYRADDLVLSISIMDSRVLDASDPQAMAIPQDVQAQVDQIVASFELLAFSEPTPAPAPAEGQPVVAWLGHVASLPPDADFDDYIILQPKQAGAVGLKGADADLEAELVALRDRQGVGEYVNVWGTLTCGVDDYGGCRILVTRLRYGQMHSDLEMVVEGWEGTLVPNVPGAQFDDYFVLAGDWAVGYGIHSLDAEIQAQLERLRGTETHFRIWGGLRAGVPDAFGTQIEVSRLEILD